MGILLPDSETERIEALERYKILDTEPEKAFDDLARLAADITDMPIALIGLIDRERQWFKAAVGTELNDIRREHSFCQHAIFEPSDLLIVADAREDERFQDLPLVTRPPNICFYAGAPIVSMDGAALGTLCVMDQVPRELNKARRASLRALAQQVMGQLDLRWVIDELRNNLEILERYEDQIEAYKKHVQQINTQALERRATDELTGVTNREAFEARLEEEFQRASRYDTPLSLVLLDLDGFAAFNEENGREAGDDVLRRVARLLDANSRSTDIVGRFGGEAFGVVLPSTTRHGAYLLAERFRQAVERVPWEKRSVTISAGASTLGHGATDLEGLISAAEDALRHSKQAGRNQVIHSGSLVEF